MPTPRGSVGPDVGPTIDTPKRVVFCTRSSVGVLEWYCVRCEQTGCCSAHRHLITSQEIAARVARFQTTGHALLDHQLRMRIEAEE
jgi:hypothetical protein